jgi:death on curing protein
VTFYLEATDLVALASRATTGDLQVRDAGLFDVAAHRPRATLFDVEVYQTLWQKAAALLDSIVRTRPLKRNNWRFGWLVMAVFCDLNGWVIDVDDDAALDLVRSVSRGSLGVDDIAATLEGWAKEKSVDA